MDIVKIPKSSPRNCLICLMKFFLNLLDPFSVSVNAIKQEPWDALLLGTYFGTCLKGKKDEVGTVVLTTDETVLQKSLVFGESSIPFDNMGRRKE